MAEALEYFQHLGSVKLVCRSAVSGHVSWSRALCRRILQVSCLHSATASVNAWMAHCLSIVLTSFCDVYWSLIVKLYVFIFPYDTVTFNF